MLKKLCLVIIIFYAFTAQGQSKFGAWYMSFNTVDFNDNWQLQNDIQYRNFNAIGDLEQLLLRGGLGYNLSENNNNFLLGYAFIRTGELDTENNVQEEHFDEHRIYQQFITNQQFGRFYLSHRYRLEERFLKNDFKIRFRYFLNLRVALNNKTLQKNTVYFSTYNEVFINGQGTIFDRNRLYGAFGYHFSNSFRVDVGAMAQIYAQTYRPQFQLGFFKAF